MLSTPTAAAFATNGTVSVPLAASLVKDNPPLTAVVDCGLKVTLNGVLWPGANVTGRLKPPTVKPAPVTFARDTVTVEPPELVSAPDKVLP